jgi:hypothetical protein
MQSGSRVIVKHRVNSDQLFRCAPKPSGYATRYRAEQARRTLRRYGVKKRGQAFTL